MCGLVGFSGKGKSNKKLLDELMLWNSLERGRDSSGIYTPKDGVIKNATPAWEFLKNKEFSEDKLFIGHVRHGTIGSVIDANAHPFHEGTVVLAHNGTLRNQWTLCNKYDLKSSDYNVDSNVICAILNKEKNANPLAEIEGTAALLFTDTINPEILYVFKHGDRTLFKGSIDGDMYISSIEQSLVYIGCQNVKEFKEDVLYTIKNGIIKTELPIKNEPYRFTPPVVTKTTSTPISSSNMDKLTSRIHLMNNPHLLDGHWIKAIKTLSVSNKKDVEISWGTYYRVRGVDNVTKSFLVSDNKGETVWVHMNSFDFEGCFMKNSFFVKFWTEIETTKTNTLIFAKDDVAQIINYDASDKTVLVKSPVTKKEYKVSIKYVRRCTQKEEDLAIGTAVAETEEDENFTSGYNEQNPSPADLEEQDVEVIAREEDDDEEYFNLMVNQDVLKEALDTQNGFTEDLLQFSTHLKGGPKSKFVKKIHEMQQHLIEAENTLIDLNEEEVEEEK